MKGKDTVQFLCWDTDLAFLQHIGMAKKHEPSLYFLIQIQIPTEFKSNVLGFFCYILYGKGPSPFKG